MNIFQQILDILAKGDGHLNQDFWHGHSYTDLRRYFDGEYCGTTHCVAGWVCSLTPDPMGVERLHGTANTAFAILERDYGIDPVESRRIFYSDEVTALEWLEEKAKKHAT